MKVLVKPEVYSTIDDKLLEAQCETQCAGIYLSCGTLCICVSKDSWYADDDSEDILF